MVENRTVICDSDLIFAKESLIIIDNEAKCVEYTFWHLLHYCFLQYNWNQVLLSLYIKYLPSEYHSTTDPSILPLFSWSRYPLFHPLLVEVLSLMVRGMSKQAVQGFLVKPIMRTSLFVRSVSVTTAEGWYLFWCILNCPSNQHRGQHNQIRANTLLQFRFISPVAVS